jgi:hypothetical protein
LQEDLVVAGIAENIKYAESNRDGRGFEGIFYIALQFLLPEVPLKGVAPR